MPIWTVLGCAPKQSTHVVTYIDAYETLGHLASFSRLIVPIASVLFSLLTTRATIWLDLVFTLLVTMVTHGKFLTYSCPPTPLSKWFLLLPLEPLLGPFYNDRHHSIVGFETCHIHPISMQNLATVSRRTVHLQSNHLWLVCQ